MITDPPSPPRPPSGPPRGLYFSRLKETLPSPPLPARTTNRASSTNCNGARYPRDAYSSGRGLLEDRLLQYADHAAAAAAHDDAAGAHQLAPVGLHAEPLASGIAAVARRAATFLMCHQIPPKSGS